MAITLAWSGDRLSYKYILTQDYWTQIFDMCILSKKDNLTVTYHFLICKSSFFSHMRWTLKRMVISYLEKATPSIPMSVNTNGTHIRRGYTFQFGNCILGGGLISIYWKENNSWNVCDGSLYLDQKNCIWIIYMYLVHMLSLEFNL